MIILKGMSWDHPRGFDPMVATSEEYSKKNPHIKIEWEKRPLQAFADRPIELMAHDYDMIVIDHPHVGEASSKELLFPIDTTTKFNNELEESLQNSVGLSHESYNFNGKQYALPIDAAAPVSAFRPDLIDVLPKSYEDVVKLAEDKKVIWPIKPVDSISYFNSIAANLGSPINEPEKHFIEKEIGIEVLLMMKKLTKLTPEYCLKMNPIQVLDYMSTNNDKVYCPILYGYSNYSRKGFRKYRIQFSNIPSFDDNNKENCKGSQIGGTGLAISKFSKNIDQVLDYSFWVISKECQSNLYYFSGGQPGRIDAWKNRKVNDDSLNFFEGTLQTLEQSWLRPRYNGYMFFQDIGGTIVNRYLDTGNDPGIVIDQLTEEFEKSFNVNIK